VDAAHAESVMDRVAFALLPRIYRLAEAIVCVSHGVRDDLLRFAALPPGKVRVIYNPVVGAELRAASAEPVNHPWLSSGNENVVIAVGSFTPVKQFDLLLRAFSRLRRGRRARLIILGDGAARSDMEGLARHLGIQDDVALPGFVGNPYAWLSKSAVFVLCSRSEALPTVVIEAMACGCRVVCTDSPGGIREILDGGRYGTLVPNGDEVALAAAIDRALGEPGKIVPEIWMEQFTIGFAAGRYQTLVQEFIDS
jgi:glycosyltransferase involved in cell wall biosynthesis